MLFYVSNKFAFSKPLAIWIVYYFRFRICCQSRNPSFYRAPGNLLMLIQCDCFIVFSNMDPLNAKDFITKFLKKVDLTQSSFKDVRNQIHERLIDEEVFISRFVVEGIMRELIPKPVDQDDQITIAAERKEEPSKCDFCEQSFPESKIIAHIKTVHFVHKCLSCSKRFVYVAALRVHLRKHCKKPPGIGGRADKNLKVGASEPKRSAPDAHNDSDSEEERLPPPVFYVKGDFIAVAQRDYYAEDYSFTDTSRGNIAFRQEATLFFNRKFKIRREVEALALPPSLLSSKKQPPTNLHQSPQDLNRTLTSRSIAAAGCLKFSPPQQVKLAPAKPFRALCRFCQWPEANSLQMLRFHIQNFHGDEYLLDLAYQRDVIAGIVEPLDC